MSEEEIATAVGQALAAKAKIEDGALIIECPSCGDHSFIFPEIRTCCSGHAVEDMFRSLANGHFIDTRECAEA